MSQLLDVLQFDPGSEKAIDDLISNEDRSNIVTSGVTSTIHHPQSVDVTGNNRARRPIHSRILNLGGDRQRGQPRLFFFNRSRRHGGGSAGTSALVELLATVFVVFGEEVDDVWKEGGLDWRK